MFSSRILVAMLALAGSSVVSKRFRLQQIALAPTHNSIDPPTHPPTLLYAHIARC